MTGRHVPIGDTRLYVEERGRGTPLLVLHGGPGLDHHMFGDYLDPLTDRCRLILVDQRSQGRSDPAPPETWTLAHMAADVDALAGALDLQQYAVLGHSFGSFVALQHAVDSPGRAWKTIVSGGVPASRHLSVVDENLASFQPEWLREQVSRSWEREKVAQTEGDVAALLHDQMPFHFANPVAPILGEYEQRSRGAVYSAEVLRHFANQEYGAIDVEARLGRVTEPVLVLAGRHDRVCSVQAAKAIAAGVRRGELVIFEHSGHMTFVEENAAYLAVLRHFLAGKPEAGSVDSQAAG